MRGKSIKRAKIGGLITLLKFVGTQLPTFSKTATSQYKRIGRLSFVAPILGFTLCNIVQAQQFIDYDSDNNGLIEISALEQLAAIRFDLDGDGVPGESTPTYVAAFPDAADNMGCPGTCIGYELMNDLDFDDAANYASGAVDQGWSKGEDRSGWHPISAYSAGDISARFTGVFNGNGHTIRNLYIKRDVTSISSLGLFGGTDNATIRNIGISGEVNSENSSPWGGGGLAGDVVGTRIENSYSAVSLRTAQSANSYIGSLVGFSLDSAVLASYATGSVYDAAYQSGLIAFSYGGDSAEHVYATGHVHGGIESGGLLAYAGNLDIRHSYSTALIRAEETVSGGVIGLVSSFALNNFDFDLDFASVYWDTDTSGQARAIGTDASTATGIIGATTAELQAPTDYNGIYDEWNDNRSDYWDFGSANQYPALKVDFDNSGTASWEEFGYQLREGPAVTITGSTASRTLSWTAPDTSHWKSPPEITYNVYRNGVATAAIDITRLTYDDDTEVAEGSDISYSVAAVVNGGEAVRSAVQFAVPITIVYDQDQNGLIEVTTLEQLAAIRFDLDGNGIPSESTPTYVAAFPDAADNMGCPDTCIGYELMNDLDFDDATDYASGAVDKGWSKGEGGSGWHPISAYSSGGNLSGVFSGVFNGNGHTIHNLYTKRDVTSINSLGLFGGIGDTTISNIGISGEVTSENSNFWGGGGLAGTVSDTVIENSYSTVSLRPAQSEGAYIGSLVGFSLDSTVRTSYASGSVYDAAYQSGLIAFSYGEDSVEHVYATGHVHGGLESGGLLAYAGNLDIRHSYSTALIRAEMPSGGVIGLVSALALGPPNNFDFDVAFTSVYWDTDTSGQAQAIGTDASTAAGIIGATSAELRAPTGYSGIYADWNANDSHGNPTDYWDFGDANQYPALKVDFDGDPNTDPSWQRFGYQLREGPTVATTGTSVSRTLSWTAPDTSHWTPPPEIAYNVYRNGVATTAIAITTLGYTDDTEVAEGSDISYSVAAVVNGGEAVRSAVQFAVPITIVYDQDQNGLIEVTTLEQLAAIRFDLDGNGIPSESTPTYVAAFPDAADNMGCPDTCIGYELMNDLDFDDATDYASGAVDKGWSKGEGGSGWYPISTYTRDDIKDRFTGVFNGNGHTIHNLYIKRNVRVTASLGLFGGIGDTTISNIGISGEVTSENSNFWGGGGLAGTVSDTVIENSYSTVSLRPAQSEGAYIGSLVGFSLDSTVRTSYASGSVYDAAYQSGLIAFSYGGDSVEHVYATGHVHGGVESGGLLSYAGNIDIRHSYSTALVHAEAVSGGVIGLVSSLALAPNNFDFDVAFTSVYWDTDTSGQAQAIGTDASTAAGIIGATSAELRAPTGYSGIYADWNANDSHGNPTDYWDFGDANQYPALKVDFDGDPNTDPSWQRFGYQLREGPTVTTIGSAASRTLSWTAPDTSHWSPAPEITYNVYRNGVATTAIGITTLSYADDTEVAEGSDISYSVAAVVNGGEAVRTAVQFAVPITIVYDQDQNGLIEVTTLEQLDAIRFDLDGNGVPSESTSTYTKAFPDARANMGCPDVCLGYELLNDLDFDDDASYSDAAENKSGWTSDPGWIPIGDDSDNFMATFNGNGHTIYSLYINRGPGRNLSLFDSIGRNSTVSNIGVTGSVLGDGDSVGGLVGELGAGTIEQSYSTVSVSGTNAGSLLGLNDGGTVRLSYASGIVSGIDNMGGLIGNAQGRLSSAQVEHVYATGFVSAPDTLSVAGGLLGSIGQLQLKYAYATGLVVSDTTEGGGLGGTSISSNFVTTAIYWDTETSGKTVAIGEILLGSASGIEGKTSAELQTPTGYDGIYVGWNDGGNSDYWDFGSASQYPALKVDFDNDGMVSWQEFGYQLREGPQDLVALESSGRVTVDWTAPTIPPEWNPPPTITYHIYRDGAALANGTAGMPSTNTSYIDDSITASVGQTYHVAAVIRGGEITRSATVSVEALKVVDTDTTGDANTATIAESATGGTAIADVMLAAQGPDGNVVSGVTWSLSDPADPDLFTINSTSGAITLIASDTLDYEDTGARSHSVTVTAEAGSYRSATLTLTINVLNVLETLTVANSGSGAIELAENATAGAVVPGIALTASDEGNNAVTDLTWSLPDNAGGLFAISAGGEVTVAGALNFEAAGGESHTLMAQAAKDGVTSVAFSITITVENVLETLTIANGGSGAIELAENAPVGTVVPGIALTVSDEGSNMVSGVVWSLTDDAGSLFAITSNTGVITAEGALDYAAATQHTVRAQASKDGIDSNELSLTIAVTDIDETLPQLQIADTDAAGDANTATIAESATGGTAIADVTLAAQDADSNVVSGVTWSLTDPSGSFAIDSANGEITLIAGKTLDYETARSHSVTVTAEASGYQSATLALTINVLNVLETLTVADSDTGDNAIAENATIGTEVSGITLTASDEGSNAVTDLTWGLPDDASGLFAIATDTGVISVAGDLDFEAAGGESHTLMAQAAKDGVTSVAFSITITVENVLETLTIADSDTGANAIAENAPAGTVVPGIALTVSDEGGRPVTDLTWSLPDNAGGLFAISTGGEVTVAGALNFEAAGGESHTLMAQAAKDGVTSVAFSITVTVENVLETLTIANGGSGAIELAENAPVGTVVPGIALTVTDEGGRPVTDLTWSLPDNAGGLFAISTGGEVTVAGALNFEAAGGESHTLMAQAAKDGVTSVAFSITVTVENVLETLTIANGGSGAIELAENAPAGTVVPGIALTVTDEGGRPLTEGLIWSLASAPTGLFGIDTGGVITVTGELDYETSTHHTVMVQATKDGIDSNELSLTIAVTDIDESLPQLQIADTDATGDANTATIAEDASADAAIADVTLAAQDADSNVVSGAVWSLTDPSGLFAIDSANGEITLVASNTLDYETARSHSVTVTAEADGYQPAIVTLTINVTNVLETLTVADSDADANTIAENATIGAEVSGVTLTASDEGSNAVTDLTWSLPDDASGLFAIATNTGVISVAGDLDFEAVGGESHTLMAQAAKDGVTSAAFSITITVENVLETLTIANGGSGAIELAENAPVGTVVPGIALTVSDEGGRPVTDLTWSLPDNAGGLFAISTGGEVTVAGALNFEAVGGESHTLMAQAAKDGVTSVAFSITVTVENVLETLTIANGGSGAIELAENAPAGTVVPGIALTVSDEGGRPVTDLTWSLPDNAGGLFAISTGGEVTVAGALNFEAAGGESHTLMAQAAKDGVTSVAFSITVTVENVLETLTIANGGSGAIELAENAPAGTVVPGIALTASDEGGRPVTDLTWSLPDNAGGLFAISTGGEVTVAGALNFEAAGGESHTLMAQAAKDGVTSVAFSITVTVENVLETLTIANGGSGAIELAENAPAGTVVPGIALTVSDEGGRPVTDLTWSLPDNAGGLFAISTGGEVTVAGALNFEAAGGESHTLMAQATKDGVTSVAFSITVTVENVLETLTIANGGSGAIELAENAPAGTVVPGIALTVSDEGGRPVTDLTWSLPDNAGGLFAISTGGEVTVAGALNFEAAGGESHTLMAQAAKDGVTSVAFSITVTVENVLETLTIANGGSGAIELAENAPVGTVVPGIALTVSDEGGRPVTDLTWSLPDNAGGLFAISTGGEVTVAGALNFEAAGGESHTLMAQAAKDGVTSVAFSITVTVENVLETLTIANGGSGAIELAENAPVGTVVPGIALTASDEGGRPVTDLTWSLTDDADSLFAITSNTGVITAEGALDYAAATQHTVTAQASKDGIDSNQLTLTIAVTDIDETLPQLQIADTDTTGAANTATIAEDATAGTAIAGVTLAAQDTDGTAVSSATWSLTDPSSLFAIGSTSGVITLAASDTLDYEDIGARNHSVTVTAAAAGFMTATLELTINVLNVLETLTIANGGSGAIELAENAPAGTVVPGINLVATENDEVITGAEWMLTDDAGSLFAITSNSGVITAEGALDYAAATQHTVRAQASKDGIDSNELSLTITVQEAASVLRLRLRLFLEGPLR